MTGSSSMSVLRPRIAPPRPSADPTLAPIEDALRVSMPRVSEELLGMELSLVSASLNARDLKGVVEDIGEFDLVTLLVKDGFPSGICMFDAAALASLIEVQTTGRVSRSDAATRKPTATDVLMISDILDRWISSGEAEFSLRQATDMLPFQGYRHGPMLPDARAVELTLDPAPYQTMRLGLEFGGGARHGNITLVTPVSDCSSVALSCDFEPHLLKLPAVMEAVLTRLSVPLSQILDFKKGDLFPVPMSSVANMTLETPQGDTVAIARLGQLNGKRAVRLSGVSLDDRDPTPDDFDNAREEMPLEVSAHLPEITNMQSQTDLPGADVQTLDPLPDLNDFPDLPDLPDLPELAPLTA